MPTPGTGGEPPPELPVGMGSWDPIEECSTRDRGNLGAELRVCCGIEEFPPGITVPQGGRQLPNGEEEEEELRLF